MRERAKSESDVAVAVGAELEFGAGDALGAGDGLAVCALDRPPAMSMMKITAKVGA